MSTPDTANTSTLSAASLEIARQLFALEAERDRLDARIADLRSKYDALIAPHPPRPTERDGEPRIRTRTPAPSLPAPGPPPRRGPGSLRERLLELLAAKPMHAMELAKILHDTPQRVYQTLTDMRRLPNTGFVGSPRDGVWSISEKGRAELARRKAEAA